MLFIMSSKKFLAKKKKLVEPKDYYIINAVSANSAEEGEFDHFSRMSRVPGISPDSKMVKARLSNDDEFDIHKIEKMDKEFFSSSEWLEGVLKCCYGLQENLNIFLILDNKSYKAYAKIFKKKIAKMYDVSFKFIFLQDDVEDKKKLLSEEMSNSELKEFISRHAKLEKKLEELEESYKIKKHKKDKKKDKDKDKDKKHSKKNKKKKKKKSDDWFDGKSSLFSGKYWD